MRPAIHAGAGSGPGGYPDYPDLPDYPQDTYSPRDTYFSGYPSTPDYPPTPDYPAAAGVPAGWPSQPNGYPAGAYPANGYPPEAYPATDRPPGGYPAGGSQVVEFPAADGGWALAAAPVTHEEYLHPGSVPAAGPARAGPDPGSPGTGRPGRARRRARCGTRPGPGGRPPDAQLGHARLPDGAVFGFLVPLAVYLTSLRRSRWLRAHAAQALNVWLTVILYELSAAIIGAMLALDSPGSH